MKYIKPLIVAATAAMMLTMSSCQLSKILPQKTETTDSTATPGVSFTLPTDQAPRLRVYQGAGSLGLMSTVTSEPIPVP